MESSRISLLMAIALIAQCTFVASVEALETSVIGHGDFQFGMTKEAVSKITNLQPQRDANNNGWYNSNETVSIIGRQYEYSMRFDGDSLVQVNLATDFADSKGLCDAEFDKALGAIISRYGAPDQPAEKSEIQGISFGNFARFTASDGSSIRLSSNYISSCLINVAYTVGGEGHF